MKKLSQKNIVRKVLEARQDWVPSYEFVKVSTQWGWLGSSGDRRARQLAEDGLIETRKIGKYAEFRALEKHDEIAARETPCPLIDYSKLRGFESQTLQMKFN